MKRELSESFSNAHLSCLPSRSIGSESTFGQDIQDTDKITEAFDSIIEDVHERLQAQKMLFRTVGIKVRLEDFENFTRKNPHEVH